MERAKSLFITFQSKEITKLTMYAISLILTTHLDLYGWYLNLESIADEMKKKKMATLLSPFDLFKSGHVSPSSIVQIILVPLWFNNIIYF